MLPLQGQGPGERAERPRRAASLWLQCPVPKTGLLSVPKTFLAGGREGGRVRRMEPGSMLRAASGQLPGHSLDSVLGILTVFGESSWGGAALLRTLRTPSHSSPSD